MKKLIIYIFICILLTSISLLAIENSSIVTIPQYLDFGPVIPFNTKTLDIKLKSQLKDVILKKTNINPSKFRIISGNITNPVTLRRDDSILISIEFSPTDSNLVYGELLIESDSGLVNKVILKGGFPFLKPNSKSLRILEPKCNETILFGDSVDILWDGVLPADTVKLEFSTDNGYSWTLIQNRAGGLQYKWYPDFQTDGCLIRATQYWPDNSSGDIILNHNSEVNSANFSSDGNLVITSTKDGNAQIFDAKNGNKIRTFSGHSGSVRWAVFSPDTHYVATASDDSSAILWETNTGKIVRVMNGHRDVVRCVNFSRDSRKLVTAGLDGYAIIWDVKSGNVKERIYAGQYDMLWYAEFHPLNDTLLTAGTEGTIKLWSFNPLRNFKKIDTLNSLIPFATFSKSGNLLGGASWSGPAYIWDLTGKRITYVIHSDSVIGVVPINSVSFNYSEDSIITAGAGDYLAKVWNTYSGTPGQILKGHNSAVQTAFFSPDGARVLTSSWDSTARIWNLYTYPLQSDTTDCIFKIRKPDVKALDVDFGRIAMGDSKDSTINSIMSNNSDFDFNIRNIFLTGTNIADFTINNLKNPDFLDSASSITYDISFEPLDTGLRRARINYVVGKDTLYSNLSGFGVAPPIIKLADEIDFGNVSFDSYRDTIVNPVLKNTGNQEIELSLNLKGADSSYFQILSPIDKVKLKPDSVAEITLRFNPTNLGYKECFLSVKYDLQLVPCDVKLMGNGTNPWIDSVLLEIPVIEAGIGDVFTVPVYLKNITKSDFPEMIDTIFADISYNATILEKLGNETISIENNTSKLKIIMPVSDLKDSVLY
ncbi:MAG: choice-of-anchor D domain-containing protein, partial [Ignavibacteriae bacterium]|nr:choice-of-anchor D domain-containing protein [Ignavibacteriota bacterium]